ncbi:MAG TPA: FlgD immunoglobulin-like domain containing protein [Candidatus Cloacimonadota bacterium]|nr:FlgD immunoglobulin-like domain containing protein [Candidatus Cloacimonadota bacterium]
MQVSVSDYHAPISSAVVNAILSRGTWQHSANLYDDGNHNDGIAGDGVPDHGKVKLSIYNLKGQKVKELVNGELQSGMHSLIWHGRDEHNRTVGSGIYFYKLQYGGKSIIRKMALMK